MLWLRKGMACMSTSRNFSRQRHLSLLQMGTAASPETSESACRGSEHGLLDDESRGHATARQDTLSLLEHTEMLITLRNMNVKPRMVATLTVRYFDAQL